MVLEETEGMNRRHFYDKDCDFYLKQFLGSLACKMRLLALEYPAVSVYRGYSHGTDFCEILCFGDLLNLVLVKI